MFNNLDSDQFAAAMDQLAGGMVFGQSLRRKYNGSRAEIEASMPDLTLVSAAQAAELHAMIPGFKPWPVGS